MKYFSCLLILCMVVFSCKNETKSSETIIGEDGIEKTQKQNDGLTLLKGEFLYIADAAVLQTHKEIYGVEIDDKMHELQNLVKPYKVEDYDWVTVEVRGQINKKPEDEEGWDYRIKIEEILNVTESVKSDSDIIKIGD